MWSTFFFFFNYYYFSFRIVVYLFISLFVFALFFLNWEFIKKQIGSQKRTTQLPKLERLNNEHIVVLEALISTCDSTCTKD